MLEGVTLLRVRGENYPDSCLASYFPGLRTPEVTRGDSSRVPIELKAFSARKLFRPELTSVLAGPHVDKYD